MPCTLPCREPLNPGEKPPFLRELPPFPQVALRAMQMLADEEAETRAVVDLISADAGFTGELLRVANSPLYGMSQQVKTLRHAIVVMGRAKLRSLTMTVAMQSYLKAPFRSPVFQRCWQHSLATALLSSGLAAIYELNQEEAYTAGLLHDAGKFALMIAYQKEYAAVLRPGLASPSHLLRRESRQFGFDHCQSGWWLLQDWGLPRDLALSAACHHEEPGLEAEEACDIVGFGCRLATALGFESHKYAEAWDMPKIVEHLPETDEQGPPELHPDLLREAVESKIGSIC